jgi:hypothetical protein
LTGLGAGALRKKREKKLIWVPEKYWSAILACLLPADGSLFAQSVFA